MPRDTLPPPLAVSAEACRDYTGHGSRLEWLETNGTGSFAMGTASGANTRRYHGLLVSALRPPTDRHVLLAKLDEQASVGGEEIPLAVNQYPGVLHPDGHRRLAGFRLDPFPTWTFDLGGARLEKSLFLVPGEQTAVVRWRATRPLRLAVQPLLAFRDYHSLARANGELDPTVRAESREGGGVLRLRPYPRLPELRLHHSAGRFRPDPAWHHQVEYLEEQARGLDFREDLWRPGVLELEVGELGAWVLATTAERRADLAEVQALERAERARRRPRAADPLLARLDAAADQFLARRADGSPTVIAGYPWFTDWGRDAMISLPGLLVARGRLDEAREVLAGFLSHLDRGLIPNRFPDRGETPEYNTADGTLWLFPAADGWLRARGDGAARPFLRDRLWPAGLEILSWHRRGTHGDIRVDPRDGLLSAGGPGTQLTWMDAKVGDWVVTPRHGKPVEVNALWYNALRIVARWGRLLGREEAAARIEVEAAGVARSFEAAFWNPERGHLHDVVRPQGPDPALRPNQLLAVSLPYPLLGPERRRSLVAAVERSLLTPVGIRTLAPGEPGYVSRYGGGPRERDGAYHQGTVWPWLLGPFVRARLAAFGASDECVARCRALVAGLASHLSEGCLGQVAEVFDADPPHRPGGAPAQAWSVAELLQLLLVDLADRGAAAELEEAARSPAGTAP